MNRDSAPPHFARRKWGAPAALRMTNQKRLKGGQSALEWESGPPAGRQRANGAGFWHD